MTFVEDFPILKDYTYLNTAGSGFISQQVSDWRRQHDEDFLKQGSIFRVQQEAFLQNVRADVARFFNADLAYTYLVPNFSRGFNVFLEGLSSDATFLLLDEDYPSVNYPVQSRGFTCNYITIDEHIEETILENVGRLKPDVFAFSLVQYISGVKIDLDFLSRLKQAFPAMLIVADGTQFCGTAAFDFERSGIDVLIASSYKWMMGGYGNGFVLLKADTAQKLYTGAKQRPLPNEPFLKNKGVLSLYFEPGHLDTLNFGSLAQSIKYLEKLGMAQVEDAIKKLSAKARDAFAARGLLSQAILGRKEHSSIFNLNLPHAVNEKLQQQGIICIVRGAGTRVSFHFYNTEEDLNKLLAVIDKA